jgi:hypothetical protein
MGLAALSIMHLTVQTMQKQHSTYSRFSTWHSRLSCAAASFQKCTPLCAAPSGGCRMVGHSTASGHLSAARFAAWTAVLSWAACSRTAAPSCASPSADSVGRSPGRPTSCATCTRRQSGRDIGGGPGTTTAHPLLVTAQGARRISSWLSVCSELLALLSKVLQGRTEGRGYWRSANVG